MERLRIRSFAFSDLPAIHLIQEQCPGAAEWRKEDYAELAGLPGGILLVAERATASRPEVVGFAAFRCVAGEAELRNIAVSPEFQRRGAARALVQEGIRRLQESKASRLFLEVRASNHPAVRLYSAVGFRLISARSNYYQAPPEDAWIMALDLTP